MSTAAIPSENFPKQRLIFLRVIMVILIDDSIMTKSAWITH